MNNDLSLLRQSWKNICSSPRENSCVIDNLRTPEDKAHFQNTGADTPKQTNFNQVSHNLPSKHPFLDNKRSSGSQEELDEYELWLKRQLKEAEIEFNRLSALTETLSAHDTWSTNLAQRSSTVIKAGTSTSQRYCTTHKCIHKEDRAAHTTPIEPAKNPQLHQPTPDQPKKEPVRHLERSLPPPHPSSSKEYLASKIAHSNDHKETQRSNKRSSFTLRPPLRTAPLIANELIPHKETQASQQTKPIFNSFSQTNKEDTSQSLPAVYFDHKNESNTDSLIVKTTIFQKPSERAFVDVETDTKEVQTAPRLVSFQLDEEEDQQPPEDDNTQRSYEHHKSSAEVEVERLKSVNSKRDARLAKSFQQNRKFESVKPFTLQQKQDLGITNRETIPKIETQHFKVNPFQQDRGSNTTNESIDFHLNNPLRLPPQPKPKPTLLISQREPHKTQQSKGEGPTAYNQATSAPPPKPPQNPITPTATLPSNLTETNIRKLQNKGDLETQVRFTRTPDQGNKPSVVKPKPLPPKKPELNKEPFDKSQNRPYSQVSLKQQKCIRPQIGDCSDAYCAVWGNSPSSETSISTMSRGCGCSGKLKSISCFPSPSPSRWFKKNSPPRKVSSTMYPAEGDNMDDCLKLCHGQPIKQGGPCSKSCRCINVNKKNPWTMKWNNCSGTDSDDMRLVPKKPPCRCCNQKQIKNGKKCCGSKRPDTPLMGMEGKPQSAKDKICKCKCSKRNPFVGNQKCAYNNTTQTDCTPLENSYSFMEDNDCLCTPTDPSKGWISPDNHNLLNHCNSLDSPPNVDCSFERTINELCGSKPVDQCQLNRRCGLDCSPCTDPTTVPMDIFQKNAHHNLFSENTDSLEREVDKITSEIGPHILRRQPVEERLPPIEESQPHVLRKQPVEERPPPIEQSQPHVLRRQPVEERPPPIEESEPHIAKVTPMLQPPPEIQTHVMNIRGEEEHEVMSPGKMRCSEQLCKQILNVSSDLDMQVCSDSSLTNLLKQLRDKCKRRQGGHPEPPKMEWKEPPKIEKEMSDLKPEVPPKMAARMKIASPPKSPPKAVSPQNSNAAPPLINCDEEVDIWSQCMAKCRKRCCNPKPKCSQSRKCHRSDMSGSSCESARQRRKPHQVRFADYDNCQPQQRNITVRQEENLPRMIRQKLAISNYCSLLCKVDSSDSESEDAKLCSLKTCTADLTYLVGLAQGLLSDSPDCILKHLSECTHTKRQAYLARCFGAILDKMACLMENWKQVSRTYYRTLNCKCGTANYKPQDMKTIWKKHHNIFLQALDIAVKESV